MKTIAPKLSELKSRQCTPEELQAALIQLIELHNGMHNDINKMIEDGRIGSVRSRQTRQEAFENIRYGL